MDNFGPDHFIIEVNYNYKNGFGSVLWKKPGGWMGGCVTSDWCKTKLGHCILNQNILPDLTNIIKINNLNHFDLIKFVVGGCESSFKDCLKQSKWHKLCWDWGVYCHILAFVFFLIPEKSFN